MNQPKMKEKIDADVNTPYAYASRTKRNIKDKHE